MGLPPGDDLDGRDDFGGDVVRDEVRQTFIFLQDVRDALDSLRAILDSNKQSASGGIGERHEGLQRAFRGRKVALELERLALRPTEKGDQIHALHFTLMRSRNQSFRAGALTKGSPSPTARPAHGKQSIQIGTARRKGETKVDGRDPFSGGARVPTSSSGWRLGRESDRGVGASRPGNSGGAKAPDFRHACRRRLGSR